MQTNFSFNFEGKVVLISGGSSGIGKAIAESFARSKATVIVMSYEPDLVDETVHEFKDAGWDARGAVADVRVPEKVHSVFDELQKKQKRLDVLVNCAGILGKKPFWEIDEPEWDNVIDTNLKGTFLTCQRAAKMMTEQKSGKIINIASMNAFVALPGVAAYAASKGGVAQLTKAIAVELAPYNIQANAIAPGFFRTRLNEKALSDPERFKKIVDNTPAHRLGKMSDLQGTALYLASEAADFVTGVILPVDGGFLAAGFCA